MATDMLIPEVTMAIATIVRQLELVHREEPLWPPRQQLQEARRRCVASDPGGVEGVLAEKIRPGGAASARGRVGTGAARKLNEARRELKRLDEQEKPKTMHPLRFKMPVAETA
jgi:hypothetical protein